MLLNFPIVIIMTSKKIPKSQKKNNIIKYDYEII